MDSEQPAFQEMVRLALLLLIATLVLGCGGVAATPIVIYITPAPPSAVPVGSTLNPATSPAATPVIGTGLWQVEPVTKDPITDELTTNVSITLPGHVGIAVVCGSGGRTAFGIAWSAFIGSKELVTVETRVGSSNPVSQLWSTEASTSFTYYPGAESTGTIAFIKSTFGQTQLAARLTTSVGGTETQTFDITGIANAVANVRTACQW